MPAITPWTPQQIVAALDKHIVGQSAAKRAVAIAVRNRWRRQQLPVELRKNITPKNILMIGPTGVGKTEIARRLAQMIGAPFLKVEVTKYTEVGYHGRDVDSIMRDLTEIAAGMVRAEQRQLVESEAATRVTERLLDLLLPQSGWDPETSEKEANRQQRTREKMKAKLLAGELEDRQVTITVDKKPSAPVALVGAGAGLEQMELEIEGMLERMLPSKSRERSLPVSAARKILLEQEADALIDRATVAEKAIDLAENHGVIFLDEIDKICGPQASHGPDVSRQGVQRDLLPIIEGTTTNTRYGPVRSDYVLFIAAGAFSLAKPSDLMPELQGRLPIRVELNDLDRADYLRILAEPEHALTKQYSELLKTEGLNISFSDDALQAMADIAYEANQASQNIGARRLHTVLEKVVEEISYAGVAHEPKDFTIDGAYVRQRLASLLQREDVARFIL